MNLLDARQKEHVIFIDGVFDGSALLLPVRHQFVDAAGIHDGARNDVRSDLLALFEHGDRDVLLIRLVEELAQVVSRSQAGGTAANDKEIDFEGFPFRHK